MFREITVLLKSTIKFLYKKCMKNICLKKKDKMAAHLIKIVWKILNEFQNIEI